MTNNILQIPIHTNTLLDCSTAPLCPPTTPLQKVCSYSTCTKNLPCTSHETGCACIAPYAGVSQSIIPPLIVTQWDVIYVTSAPFVLWSLTLIIMFLRFSNKIKTWSDAPFPSTLRASLRRDAVMLTLLCGGTTLGLIYLGTTLPPDIWGSCSNTGTCVYHQMFCEATNESSPIRHFSNFWSNLPYTLVSLSLFYTTVVDYIQGLTRPYQLLDAIFAVALFGLSVFSYLWHGSNCTAVHMYDIGLVAAVISFFPFRSLATIYARLMHVSEASVSTPAAVIYAALCVGLVLEQVRHTETFVEAYPTGRSRVAAGDVMAWEVLAYVGGPGLFPVPYLVLCYLKKSWGYVPSLLVTMVMLPVAFMGHTSERLVLDLWCDPTNVLQPTAVFHLMSGLAIGTCYIGYRAMDLE